VPLADVYFRANSISADGRQLLGQVWDAENKRAALGLLLVADGSIEQVPDLPVFTRFAPDGRA
jgi:hypothetical protein